VNRRQVLRPQPRAWRSCSCDTSLLTTRTFSRRSCPPNASIALDRGLFRLSARATAGLHLRSIICFNRRPLSRGRCLSESFLPGTGSDGAQGVLAINVLNQGDELLLKQRDLQRACSAPDTACARCRTGFVLACLGAGLCNRARGLLDRHHFSRDHRARGYTVARTTFDTDLSESSLGTRCAPVCIPIALRRTLWCNRLFTDSQEPSFK
jgi:hypothetical protein